MYFRLLADASLQDQWFLDTPINAAGDQWAFWGLLQGRAVHGDDLSAWRTTIKRTGHPLQFSFAGFDVPVVSRELAAVFAEHALAEHQLVPLEITAGPSGYQLLVVTRAIQCVDDRRSEFTRWSHTDGRPDKVGTYRMFTRLRLSPRAIPEALQIFRVSEWQQALVVSERLAERLRRSISAGLVYESVA